MLEFPVDFPSIWCHPRVCQIFWEIYVYESTFLGDVQLDEGDPV